jgi:MSHA biogenesis protein MshM
MYLDHFGLDSAPFNITSDTDFFYDGATRGATLDALLYAVEQGEGIIKVTGEVGSGKTMLCRMLVESLPDNVETIFLSIPSLKRDEMLQALCIELGLEIDGLAPYRLLAALQAKLIALYGQDCRVVALIDEAHAMPLESLEEIRLLSNLENGDHKLLQIVLFGQPELDDHLRLPHMRQLKERITHNFRLGPLTRADVAPYLNHRLESAGYRGPALFSGPCVNLIAKASEGLTRRVNILADKSLLAAYAENTRVVTPAHVRAAISDSDLRLPPQWGKRIAVGAATLAAAAGIGFGLNSAHLFDGPAAHGTTQAAVAQTAPTLVAEKSAAPSAQSPEVQKTMATPASANETKTEPEPGKPAKDEKQPEPALTNNKAVVSKEKNGLPASSAKDGQSTSLPATPLTEELKSAASAANETLSAANADQTAAKTSGAAVKPAILAVMAKPDLVENQKTVNKQLVNNSTLTKPETEKPTDSPAPASADPLLENRISLSKTWLEGQAENQCVIQLLMADMSNKGNVAYFVGQADRQLGPGKIYVLPSQINGQDKYTVIYGNFAGGMNCQTALGKLPAPYRQAKPYTRSVGLLRNEVKFPG